MECLLLIENQKMKTIKKVQFAYRLVIDASTTSIWEKYVFDATYKEYYLQEQLFQQETNKVETFRELLRQNKKAEQLHYLVGMATIPYIEQLEGNLYQITDNLNKTHLNFVDFELDIINSSNQNHANHKVALTFYTKQYFYFGEVNNHYLISSDEELKTNIKTLMIPNRQHFSIVSIELEDE